MYCRLVEGKSDFIDENNLAVWGWSYGGFAVAHMIEQGGSKYFKCAASIAPVSNFEYYG